MSTKTWPCSKAWGAASPGTDSVDVNAVSQATTPFALRNIFLQNQSMLSILGVPHLLCLGKHCAMTGRRSL